MKKILRATSFPTLIALFLVGVVERQIVITPIPGIAGGNPFNQTLNTTSSPTFAGLIVTDHIEATNTTSTSILSGTSAERIDVGDGSVSLQADNFVILSTNAPSEHIVRLTSDGHIRADTTNTVDLGTTDNRWKDGWFAGTVTTANLAANLTINGSTPTVSDTSANSCGTGTQTIVGNNNVGKVTVIGSAGTSCTVTFTTAYANAPSCTVTNETTANLARSTSTTTTVILAGTFLENDVLSYICIGR